MIAPGIRNVNLRDRVRAAHSNQSLLAAVNLKVFNGSLFGEEEKEGVSYIVVEESGGIYRPN